MVKSPILITDKIRSWLLDQTDPDARYLAIRNLSLSGRRDLDAAAARAHQKGHIHLILDQMDPKGFWEKDGPGYLPKYRSTVWSLILLAQLGASCEYDPRIQLACQRYLENSLTENGQFSTTGTASGTADCLQGNILTALLDLGFQDERLDQAFEWMARSLTGEGVSPMSSAKAPLRYYSGKIGPDFQCGANNKFSCAWGGAKVMLAFSKLPPEKYTPLIERAIKRGCDFFLASNLAKADYPNGWSTKPSRNWWKFGFPVFYVTDLLQVCEALVNLGHGADPQLERALQLVLEKRDPEGRWLLEYDYTGKTWLDFGSKNTPNKWVTIRALHVLMARDKQPDRL